MYTMAIRRKEQKEDTLLFYRLRSVRNERGVCINKHLPPFEPGLFLLILDDGEGLDVYFAVVWLQES